MPLPHRPIITRWGTWLDRVEYYANTFEKIENILSKLTEEDSAVLETTKNSFSRLRIKLQIDLIFISSNYGFLSCSITKLERTSLPLTLQIAIVNKAIRKIEKVNGPIGIQLNLKMTGIIRKNSSFETLKLFSNIFTGIEHDYLTTNIQIWK